MADVVTKSVRLMDGEVRLYPRVKLEDIVKSVTADGTETVAKLVEQNTTSSNIVYGTSKVINGDTIIQASLPYSEAANGGTIAKRDNSGRLDVADPTETIQAVNMGYANTHYGRLSSGNDWTNLNRFNTESISVHATDKSIYMKLTNQGFVVKTSPSSEEHNITLQDANGTIAYLGDVSSTATSTLASAKTYTDQQINAKLSGSIWDSSKVVYGETESTDTTWGTASMVLASRLEDGHMLAKEAYRVQTTMTTTETHDTLPTSKAVLDFVMTRITLLEWGGPNIERGFSALDAALSDELSANRFAEMPNANFVFERSDNAGTTWTTYTANGYALTTADTNTVCNANALGSQSPSNWHRFTIDVRPASSNTFYGEIRKFLFNISTNGATGCKVKIDGSTFANPDTFVKIVEAPIDGWSGWNVINVNIVAGLGNDTFYKKLRFTFSQTGVNTSYNSNLIVSKMRVYCANCWSAPGSFALQNRPYRIVNGEQVQQYSIRFVAGRKLYGIASNADLANNSLRLGDQLPAYYLNYQNLSNKPTLKIVAGATSTASTNNASSNPYINSVFDGATASSIQLYSAELNIESNSFGKITIAPSVAPGMFATDIPTAVSPGYSTDPYLRLAYGQVYSTGPRLKSGINIQIHSDTSNNITINSTIPDATSSTTGLMTSTHVQRLSALWNVVGSNNFKSVTGTFTGLSGTIYYSVSAYDDRYNDITKVRGMLKIIHATTSEDYKYKIINLSNIKGKLGTTFSNLTQANFLDGYWWGNVLEDSSLDMFGYGTAIMTTDSASFLSMGRYYTTSFAYGSWAQDSLKNAMRNNCVFFEMWFAKP